jgi:hydrogenase maturation protease
MEHDGEPAGLLDAWDAADLAIVVDAVCSSEVDPGHVHRVEITGSHHRVSTRTVSSHGIDAGDVVELARALGRLPRRLILYGIEGANFAPGLGLSTEVEASVNGLVGRVLHEVAADVR